jgi:hypothetical protein
VKKPVPLPGPGRPRRVEGDDGGAAAAMIAGA